MITQASDKSSRPGVQCSDPLQTPPGWGDTLPDHPTTPGGFCVPEPDSSRAQSARLRTGRSLVWASPPSPPPHIGHQYQQSWGHAAGHFHLQARPGRPDFGQSRALTQGLLNLSMEVLGSPQSGVVPPPRHTGGSANPEDPLLWELLPISFLQPPACWAPRPSLAL